MHLYSHMYIAGLLLGLIFNTLIYLFSRKMKHNNRMTIIFVLAIILFILGLLIDNITGEAIGFFSLGIYTTALFLSLFGIQASWSKFVYIGIILSIVVWYLFYFF